MRLFRGASTRCSLRRWAGRWRCLKAQANSRANALDIIVCLALILAFLPLVPVFKTFGEIGEIVRDDE